MGYCVFLPLVVSASFLTWSSIIEPNWLRTTQISWQLPTKHAHLHGMRIVQISDLHFGRHVPLSFLRKISQIIRNISPDLLVFCGDFICRSTIQKADVLQKFLNSLHAPLGVFGILGNHDYQTYVSRNAQGFIDVIPAKNSQPLKRAFVSVYQSFFTSNSNRFVKGFQKQQPHTDLLKLLQQTPIQILHNQTHIIPNAFNIVGFGDLFAKQFRPDLAFTNYDARLPGILLTHNPDTALTLCNYPGDLILAGHTHGPQISLPWPKPLQSLTNKLSGLENPELSRGLFPFFHKHKLLYVNRGLGGLKRIRFCSPPEICLIRCEYAR